jgi:hypothetical protein
MRKKTVNDQNVIRYVYDLLKPEDKYLMNEDLFKIYRDILSRREMHHGEMLAQRKAEPLSLSP